MPVRDAIILRLQNLRGWRMTDHEQKSENNAPTQADRDMLSQVQQPKPKIAVVVKEVGGPKGLEPTRYGDWERNGRCIDF